MVARTRVLLGACLAVILLGGLVVPAAHAASVSRVSGLAAAGSSATNAKLGLRWRKVAGATYQVRWAPSKGKLRSATVYTVRTPRATSPALSNVCTTWYAQVRARKGTRVGPWSAPKALRFRISSVHVPTPITTGQTQGGQAQVRWARTAGARGYRLDWAPAPFSNWPGLEHRYTAWTPSSATGTAVTLPARGPGDHFIAPGYGNPIFARLEMKRCNGSVTRTHYFPVYPKAAPPGSAATGTPMRVGSYNVEREPQATDRARISALADNIATSGVDVIALQEANDDTAAALIDRLRSAEGQGDWAACGQLQQQVVWRTSRWTEVSCDDVGRAADGQAGVASNAAQTPLPTPAVHLSPTVADPARQDVYVVSVHLEDRKRFDTHATIPEEKHDAHVAAASLIATIAQRVGARLPVVVAGDLKGKFGGGGQSPTAGNCDESSRPRCEGEGQPTFVRAGYYDARGAVSRVGTEYGSVNGHLGRQTPVDSGVGGRADFILVRGFSGVSRYVNRVNRMYPHQGLAGDTPSDHNLVYADLFVPFAS